MAKASREFLPELIAVVVDMVDEQRAALEDWNDATTLKTLCNLCLVNRLCRDYAQKILYQNLVVGGTHVDAKKARLLLRTMMITPRLAKQVQRLICKSWVVEREFPWAVSDTLHVNITYDEVVHHLNRFTRPEDPEEPCVEDVVLTFLIAKCVNVTQIELIHQSSRSNFSKSSLIALAELWNTMSRDTDSISAPLSEVTYLSTFLVESGERINVSELWPLLQLPKLKKWSGSMVQCSGITDASPARGSLALLESVTLDSSSFSGSSLTALLEMCKTPTELNLRNWSPDRNEPDNGPYGPVDKIEQALSCPGQSLNVLVIEPSQFTGTLTEPRLAVDEPRLTGLRHIIRSLPALRSLTASRGLLFDKRDAYGNVMSDLDVLPHTLIELVLGPCNSSSVACTDFNESLLKILSSPRLTKLQHVTLTHRVLASRQEYDKCDHRLSWDQIERLGWNMTFEDFGRSVTTYVSSSEPERVQDIFTSFLMFDRISQAESREHLNTYTY